MELDFITSKEVKMVIGPKMDSWGCAICYNHIKIKGEHHCGLVNKYIESLLSCPLGKIKKSES